MKYLNGRTNPGRNHATATPHQDRLAEGQANDSPHNAKGCTKTVNPVTALHDRGKPCANLGNKVIFGSDGFFYSFFRSTSVRWPFTRRWWRERRRGRPKTKGGDRGEDDAPSRTGKMDETRPRRAVNATGNGKKKSNRHLIRQASVLPNKSPTRKQPPKRRANAPGSPGNIVLSADSAWAFTRPQKKWSPAAARGHPMCRRQVRRRKNTMCGAAVRRSP